MKLMEESNETLEELSAFRGDDADRRRGAAAVDGARRPAAPAASSRNCSST